METLVAISIFSVSIVAVMVVLGKSMADTNYAKQKIIAEYLAQEGVEYMRNLRDTYVLYGGRGNQSGWSTFNNRLISGGCSSANGCYFDGENINYSDSSQPMADLDIRNCASGCPALFYNTTSGQYAYSSGGGLVNSGFVRKVTAITNTDETKISSTVYWSQGSGTHSVTLSTILYNWTE